MKKIIIIMGIYIVIAGTLLVIMSIPPKVDQEKYEAKIQSIMDAMRKSSEERWPNMPEYVRENSLEINENIIRNSYKASNTFSARFKKNLKAFFIGLIIVGVVIVLGYIRGIGLWW